MCELHAGWEARRRGPQNNARIGLRLSHRPAARKRDPHYVPRSSPLAAQTVLQRLEQKVIGRFKGVNQSVKKLNVVAKLVRRLHVDDAILQLSMYNKRLSARTILNVRPAHAL